LIWDGKYDGKGRRTLATLFRPPPTLSLSEQYPPNKPAGGRELWRNRLILGDNLPALQALLPEFRGQVQLIYIDPPFDAGSDFSLSLRQPGPGGGVIRGVAYRDRWGRGAHSYLHLMYERLLLLRELLAESGGLFLHCDWRSSAPLRLMLDEVFGRERFVNEIVWHYYNKYSGGKGCLPRAHDTILLYGKSERFTVNPLRLPREAPIRQLRRQAVDGVLKNVKGPDGRVLYRVVTDRKADDVWDLPQMQPASLQWTGYGTQKHHDLLARILALASRPGDLVADLFCGSGTTLTVAQELGRRWIGCDLGLPALHVTRRRLWAPAQQEIESAPGFDVYALSEAERRAFVRDIGGHRALVRHVLKQLGADSAPDATGADGLLGTALVHVAPGTGVWSAQQVARLARSASARGQQRLLCIAWEYQPGLWQELEAAGLAEAILPVLLPREWLAPHEPIAVPFRVLPRIRVSWQGPSASAGGGTVELLDWRAPSIGRAGTSDTSHAGGGIDDVDAWAVQTGWRSGEPFAPQVWVYRSRRRPRLATRLALAPPERGLVLIKAWDAFGREGTAVLPLPPTGGTGGTRRSARR
jgi:hypothetical protein